MDPSLAVPRSATTRRWLALSGWGLFALANLAFFLLDLRLDFAQMLVPCDAGVCNFLSLSSAEVSVLATWGWSTQAYAIFIASVSVIQVLVYWSLGGLVLWRLGATRAGLAVSLALISIPISLIAGSSDWPAHYPELLVPGMLTSQLGSATMLTFFYLVPNGRFSPRWSFVPLLATIGMLSILSLEINGLLAVPAGVLSLVKNTAVGLVFAAGAFQVYRYRRDSTPLERQQTKWILSGVLIQILGVVVWALVFGGVLTIPPGQPRLLASLLGWASDLVTGLAMPAAITISILRYKLWDIDVIIRRTLQYALLTGLLALVFFGTVVVLQSIITAAGGEQTAAVTVLSTLAIAALFTPLRRRVQAFIDRRFYRSKYAAELVLAVFGESVRDEVDLDRLAAAALSVVEETMQPAHTSLWLAQVARQRSPGRVV